MAAISPGAPPARTHPMWCGSRRSPATRRPPARTRRASGRFSVLVYAASRSSLSRDSRSCSNSGRARSDSAAVGSMARDSSGSSLGSTSTAVVSIRLADEIAENLERRAARGLRLVPLDAGPHPFRLDLRRVATQRRARFHPRPHRRQPGVQIGDERVEFLGPLGQQKRREESGVHVGPELVERDVHARLRLRVPRLLDLASAGHVPTIVDRLLDIQRRLPMLLGQIGEDDAGEDLVGRGDVALIGCEPVDRHLRQPVGADHRNPLIGGGAEHLALMARGSVRSADSCMRSTRMVSWACATRPRRISADVMLESARITAEALPGRSREESAAVPRGRRASWTRRAKAAARAPAGWRTERSAVPSGSRRTARR